VIIKRHTLESAFAKQANGLVGLLTLLEKIDEVDGAHSLTRRASDQLAGPRNDAAHRGLPPVDANAARRALATADLRLRISDRATSSVVDVAPVAESDDDHGEDLVVDRVADAVVTNADAETVSPVEGPGPWGTWAVCEQPDGSLNAEADLRVELSQRSDSGWAELDAVLAHTQPRSALTCSHGMLGPSSVIAASNAARSSASSSAVMSCS